MNEEIYIKALKKVECPYFNPDGTIKKGMFDPGGCPCMYPKPCEVEILISTPELREIICK